MIWTYPISHFLEKHWYDSFLHLYQRAPLQTIFRFFVKFGGTSSIVNKESWLSVVCFLPYCTSAFLPL